MKIAIVFPGQGSQRQGMLQGFAETPVVRQTMDEASAALGQDLWQMIESGPPEELNATVNTQPVMLSSAYAMYRAWESAGGPRAAVMAGHSLGEYTALVAAGALAFAEAVPLVRFRAQAMQEAVPMGTGGMAVIMGLDAAAVKAACEEAAQGDVVEAVNFNDQAQIVIAGLKPAVERACVAAKARGAKRALPLPVSAPFHSSLLKPAAERLRARLADTGIKQPAIPVIHNFDVTTHAEPAAIREALAQQAANPVRWVETVQAMAAMGVTHVVEIGPGKVLQGLVKRIAPEISALAVTDAESLKSTLEALT
jgi:[acyl-carrier-protein] S-malonyltransferase